MIDINKLHKLETEAKQYPWEFCKRCHRSYHEDEPSECICPKSDKNMDDVFKQMEEENGSNNNNKKKGGSH